MFKVINNKETKKKFLQIQQVLKGYLFQRSIEKLINGYSIFYEISVGCFVQSKHALKLNRQKYTLRRVL